MSTTDILRVSDIAPFALPAVSVAYFGDSRIANGYNGFLQPGTLARGMSFWVETLSNGRLRAPASMNFGVVGDTTTQMVARLPAVIASGANVVVFIGGTNDRGGISLATSIANYETIKAAVLAAGKIFVPICEWPKSSPATAFTGSVLGDHYRYADHIRQSASPGCIPIDSWAQVCDRIAGSWLTNLTVDGLHPAPGAALRTARLIVAELSKVYPSCLLLPTNNLEQYDPTNNPLGSLFTNPYMSGTSGSLGTGASGSVANTWSANGTSDLSIVCSKITFNGQVGQRLVVSGTPATDESISLARNMTTTNYSVGDTMLGMCQFRVATGNTGLAGVSITLNNADGADDGQGGGFSGTDLAMPDDGLDIIGTMLTSNWIAPSPKPSNIGLYASLTFKAGIAAAAIFDIYCLSARKVGV